MKTLLGSISEKEVKNYFEIIPLELFEIGMTKFNNKIEFYSWLNTFDDGLGEKPIENINSKNIKELLINLN